MIINDHETMNETYYSLKEVSKILKVAYLTVYRWVRAGQLKAYRVQKQYRINKTDLDAFMQSYKDKSK